MGFQISGFSSSINRCGGSHVVDGKATGVRYNDNDKLCMNGQRLILVSGTHWQNGAVYRSEIDDFSKVEYETFNGAPYNRFKVSSRDGGIAYYGWRVGVSPAGIAEGKNVSAWLLSSQWDRSGNSISYQYQHIGRDYWLPKQVVWNNRSGQTGDRKAVFEYVTRADKRIAYQGGLRWESNHLLRYIKTYIGSDLIKQYEFGYQFNQTSHLYRLIWVQQSGSDGGKMPAHYFQWNDTARGFAQNTAYQLPVFAYDYQEQFEIDTQTGDFIDVNNDGLVDFVMSYRDLSNTPHHAIYKNTGSGWQYIGYKPPTSFVMRDYRVRKKNLQQGVYADVNGDGYPDIVRAYSVVYINGVREIKKEVWLNNQNWGWNRSNTFVPPTVMWTYSAGWGANRNTSIDTDQFNFREPYLYVPMTKGQMSDINGDGLVDWIVSYNNFQNVNRRGVWLNNGSSWVRTASYDPPFQAVFDSYWEYNAQVTSTINATRLVDVNGDGLQDLVKSVRFKAGAPTATQYDLRQTWINTGSGWQHSPEYQLPDFMLDYTRAIAQNGTSRDLLPQSRGSFVDVNGDGLVDWVRSYKDYLNNTEYKYTWLNTGKGWAANLAYKLPGSVMNDYSMATGNQSGHPSGTFFDINRDGLLDWVVAHKKLSGTSVRNTYLNSGTGWKPADANYRFPNHLIDNSIGWEKSSVQYGGLMDINGDGAVDYLMSAKNIFGHPVKATYLGNAKPADMVIKITDTLGAETKVAYKSMMDSDVYQFYTSWNPTINFDNQKVIGPMPVVSETQTSNGIGGYYRLQYFYSNALSNGQRGYQGFKQRRVWDPQQKMLSFKDFYHDFPVSGMTKRELVYYADAITRTGNVDTSQNHQLLSQNLNYLKYVNNHQSEGSVLNIGRITHGDGRYTYAPQVHRTRQIEYEWGQIPALRSVWANLVYDEYANVLASRVITIPGGGEISVHQDLTNHYHTLTQTSFTNDTDNWLIGMPNYVKVTHHVSGQTDQVRETAMAYNGIGQLLKTVIEPNKPEFRLETSHTYDGYGNEITTTINGEGIQPRTSTTTYDNKGLHVIGKTNALGHSASITPDVKCDAPANTTDANGLVTSITYDQFCRQIRTDHPDGTWSTLTHNHAARTVTTQATASPTLINYYDKLGRTTRSQTQGFDGRTLITETQYNNKGQIYRQSLPYYQDDIVYWTTHYYDPVSRLVRTRAPGETESTISYSGLTTVVTNAKGQIQTQVSDVAGRVHTVIDDQGNTITYAYDAVGNLLSTTDPENNQVRVGYDHVGNKIWMDDPDMGYWTYEYDVLGQLIKQTDAKGQVITTDFDKLGRLIERKVQPDTVDEQVSTWTYDTADNGIGLLDETAAGLNYLRRHTYDSLSRLKNTYETIDNLMMVSLNYYNSSGQLSEVRYPGRGYSHTPGRLDRIRYQYNDLGYLERINNYSTANGAAVTEELWALEAMDAKGNVTQERYGNGVSVSRTYHPTRNFLWYLDSNLGSTPIQDLAYWHDSIGNMVGRRDDLMGQMRTSLMII